MIATNLSGCFFVAQAQELAAPRRLLASGASSPRTASVLAADGAHLVNTL